MSVFKSISSVELLKYLKLIRRDVECLHHVYNYDLMCYCLGLMYDYCTCRAYLELNGIEAAKDVEVTVDDLKHYLKNSGISVDDICDVFCEAVDKFRNSPVEALQSRMIERLFATDKFYSILEASSIPAKVIDRLRYVYRNLDGNLYWTSRDLLSDEPPVSKLDKVFAIMKEFSVPRIYISDYVDLEDDFPSGDIYIPMPDNSKLALAFYDLFGYDGLPCEEYGQNFCVHFVPSDPSQYSYFRSDHTREISLPSE